MKNLKILVCKSGDEEKPEKIITIPLTVLRIAVQLLPKKIRFILEKEGIDVSQCSELLKEKDLKGTLIEIESPDEKLMLSIE